MADELYGLDPSEFVTARRAAVASAKKSGDAALAKQLGALRKPTTTGWALNLLVRADRGSIDGLLDLGATLRSAQQALRGDELRTLAARRGAVVSALADRAADLAEQRGHRLTESARREIGQSLSAALADPDVAADLRRGRMLGAVSYSGFGPAALVSVPAPVDRPPKTPVPDETPSADAAQEERRRARAAALDSLKEAEALVRDTASDLEEAAAREEATARRVDEVRSALERAEQELRFAASARQVADDAAQSAARDLARARAAAEEFDS